MVRTVVIGTILGFVAGMLFSILYFGDTALNTPMAYIHDASGALLGFLISWIVALQRARKRQY